MGISLKVLTLVLLSMAGGAYAGTSAAVPAVMPDSAVQRAAAPDLQHKWVTIPAGTFSMGTMEAGMIFADARPVREVRVKAFKMSKTPVTVAQYAECVAKARCTAPAAGGRCNWGVPGRETHPVNCVDWGQARAYAGFIGARLPSEAEWEYAATSGGKKRKYPWGDALPSEELAPLSPAGTAPVCFTPAGNTEQGLCDMAGNVWQWVQDGYRDSYSGAPEDGSAAGVAGSGRVLRGGSFSSLDARDLRVEYRRLGAPGERPFNAGFRLAR